MAKATPLIISFNGGETSPKISARSDITKYSSACRTLENFLPLVEGGAARMPGTYFVIETKDSTKKSRLIPFHFSTIQAYVLEVGNKYIRFYKDEGQIVLSYSAWLTAQAYTPGLLRTNAGSYYRCIIAHTSGTFATDLTAGYWEATDGALDLAYEIPTPYLEADLPALKVTQSADTMYLFHPSYSPRTLTRTAHTSWTLSDLVCKKVAAAMVITAITKAATAVVTCTTVPTTLAAGDIVYITGCVGMTEVNNIFFTVGTVVTGAGGTFQLSGINSTGYGAWSSGGTAQETIYGTTGNNPSCGTFFEQRLATAGTNNNPQTVNLSVSADYPNNTLGSAADDAISYTVVSDRVDRIYWLMGFEFLVAGTVGGVWKIGATSSAEPMTATNITAKKQVALGSKNIEPEVVSDILLWVTGSGQSIQQFAFSFEKDKWIALDMTRIAKHIAVGDTLALSGFTDLDYQKEPLPIMWCIRADGQLIGLTYETQEDVYAWFRIVTDGLFESIAVISQEDEEDQLWSIVKRTIDGSTARYIEYFKPINFYSEIKDAFFVHCGLTYDGGAAATVTAISNTDPCVVTLAAGHVLVTGDKIRFHGTGTWLDTHIVTAHLVAGNAMTVWNEADDDGIISTQFPVYVYPPVATTTTYTGTPVNIVYAQQSNPCKVFAPNHGIIASTPVRIASVVGMTGINGDWTTVSVSQDSFTISLDATALTAYTSGGTVTEGETTTLDAATVEEVKKAFTTLNHLEAKSVSILVDGAAHPNETVASGAITLDYYGNRIHIGLPYTSTLEPMKIHAGSQLGTSRGKKQKINRLTALFYETVGGKTGPDSDNLKIIPFGTGVQPELFTGDIDVEFNSGWDNSATITIVQDQPLPITVLGIVPSFQVNE